MTRYIKRNSRTDMSFAPLPENPNKVGFIQVKLENRNGSNIPVFDEKSRKVVITKYTVARRGTLYVVTLGVKSQLTHTHEAMEFLEKNNNLIAYWDNRSILFVTSHQTTANHLAELLQVARISESTMSGERCLELTR